jgi:hypothetical protein
MIKMKYTFLAILVFLNLSCHSGNQECILVNDKVLNLYPVNCLFKLPEFKIDDSTRYDQEEILNYRVKFIDTSLSMNCYVKSYGKRPDAQPDFLSLKENQKLEVEFNRQAPRLLIDTINRVSSTDIGYVKYLIDMSGEKFYEGRIFFLKRGNLVTVWLYEKYKSELYNKKSAIDCIVKSMTID